MKSMTISNNVDYEEKDVYGVKSQQNSHDDDEIETTNEQTPRQGCCQKFRDRYPRLFAIVFGIYIPVFFLVILCSCFGYWIAHLESPTEIKQNDARIASYVTTTRKLLMLSNLTGISPKVCFNLFLNNVTADMLMTTPLVDVLYEGIDDDPSTSMTDKNSTSTETLYQIKDRFESIAYDMLPERYNNSESVDSELNLVDLYHFLQICGEKFRTFIYNESDLAILPGSGDSSMLGMAGPPILSFSWNRCTPYNFFDQINFTTALEPINQTQYFFDTWKVDESRLYEYYFDYYVTTWNVSTNIATVLAQQQSVAEATGEAACSANVFSGAWFWFTIMATIGYGNVTVETTYGRTLIYTFGFFSILLFGGISLCAGAVTVAMFKATCIHWNVPFLTAPWIASIIWGSLYYAWMCAIANNYANWNAERLSTSDVGFRDGYWFAYISTTTVGLGDFILEPAVLVASDMFFWPFMFMTGFVLFSAFICNLSSVVMKPVHNYTTNLAERLETTNMFFGKPTRKSRNYSHVYASLDDRRVSIEESSVPKQPISEQTTNEKETEH